MGDINRLVIGISGGIAAYKIPQLIRLLKVNGVETKTVLAPSALPLVGEDALRTVSANQVYRDGVVNYDMDHIRLAEWGQKFLVCPATANTIAKIAHGIADNLLTTLALSFRESQIIVAPAMNTIMWESKATQENISTLKRRGITVLPVGFGKLACDVTGAGRMLEPEEIVSYVIASSKSDETLNGKRILISSGPTEEPIDPVRVITNKSSGKMGVALAREALIKGAQVTVVSGPSKAVFPSSVCMRNVTTAQQMHDVLHEEFANADVCIMAAAVSDYRVVNYSESKIKRNKSGSITLELCPNPDIAATLGIIKGKRILVGFALESSDDESVALAKMNNKGCDYIVFNRVDKALGLDSTSIVILGSNGFRKAIDCADKSVAAQAVLECVASQLGR
ncbi:MAG: bifunctional phosphopantothenoylcysteine decarboxylase/phosphopantothenate--cysteine ligase CoaBC [Fibrobacterota bacterium]|nr:bifunctional phosphopantothenoylcysteine decarboxylase/phosphopantothenate--cysteine ligase CoaBC [Chitinispirillaceae bacterium]